jgi:hypothetical protein
MEAIKIKAFFSTLKAKKINGVVPELGEVQEASDGYKQWTTVGEMRGEYRRRMESGTIKKLLRQPKDKHGWAMALELNDLQAASTITNNMEEAAHAERAAETMAEDGDQSGVDFEDDGGDLMRKMATLRQGMPTYNTTSWGTMGPLLSDAVVRDTMPYCAMPCCVAPS